MDSLDWLEVFGRVSRAEQELNRDPSGAYPRMEEASKAQVRERVRMLANRLEPVSYTHLDVYKRQPMDQAP